MLQLGRGKLHDDLTFDGPVTGGGIAGPVAMKRAVHVVGPDITDRDDLHVIGINRADEHAAFVASVLDGAPVVVDAATGRRALAAALMVADRIAAARTRMIASGLIEEPQNSGSRSI